MTQQPVRWKRALKWIGFAFLMFLTLLYAWTLGKPGPNRGAIAVLLLLCATGAWYLWNSLDDETADLADKETLVKLQHDTIDLAMEHGGALTVTDVSTDLNIVISDAEYVLKSLEDGIRVISTVTPEGVIVYQFREVMHRLARMGQAGGTPPHAG